MATPYDVKSAYGGGICTSITTNISETLDTWLIPFQVLMGMPYRLTIEELVEPTNIAFLTMRLLEKSLNVNDVDEFGNTLLHYSCSINNFTATELIIKTSLPNLELKNKLGRAPLHLAALFGNFQCIKILLEKGAKVLTEDSNKNTPLHYACVNQRFVCCKLLLDHGADLTRRNSLFATCLDCLRHEEDRADIQQYAMHRRARLTNSAAHSSSSSASSSTTARAGSTSRAVTDSQYTPPQRLGRDANTGITHYLPESESEPGYWVIPSSWRMPSHLSSSARVTGAMLPQPEDNSATLDPDPDPDPDPDGTADINHYDDDDGFDYDSNEGDEATNTQLPLPLPLPVRPHSRSGRRSIKTQGQDRARRGQATRTTTTDSIATSLHLYIVVLLQILDSHPVPVYVLSAVLLAWLSNYTKSYS